MRKKRGIFKKVYRIIRGNKKNKKNIKKQMPTCDLCGKEAPLLRVQLEGAEVAACKSCASHGRVLGHVKNSSPAARGSKARQMSVKEPDEEIIVPNYAALIRTAREKRDVRQEDFAKQINEKLSALHKIETGFLTPSLELAKKLEKVLSIKLIEKVSIAEIIPKAEKSGGMTIGDVLKIKMKREER